MKKILSLVTAAAIMTGVSSTVYSKDNYDVKRIYGNTRYETSLNISNTFSSEKVNNVIVASGNNFPDALAGSVLSKKLNAPILLAGKDNNESADSINYIKSHLDINGTIYILGGSASISENYVNNLKSLGYNNIKRLGGRDRFDTNSIIVNSMDIKKGTPIVLVNGYGFADALSVSSIAASKGYPILMSEASSLSENVISQIKSIQPSDVYIIGGQGSLNNAVIDQVKSIVPSLDSNNITRIGGQDRYETSLNICKYFNLSTDTAIVANGENFPDALSGSALASKLNAPIILTDGRDISKQKQYTDGASYSNLILLGGKGSISQSVEDIFNGIENRKRLEFEDFELGGLKLSMNKDELFEIKGEAKDIITDNNQDFGTYETYILEDCNVSFYDYGGEYGPYMWDITTTNSNVKGPRDIKVGDSVDDVLKKFPYEDNPIIDTVKFLYGKEYDYNGKAFYDDNGNLTRIMYVAGIGTFDVGALDLTIEDGKVVQMSIWVPTV